ncbi:MAG: type II secretion system F family protein, partial [Propionicimonas sp.]
AGLGWWGLPAAAIVGVVSYAVLGRLESAAALRRNFQLTAALPQVCDLLAVCLEAGLPLRRAVEAIAEAAGDPIREPLAQVAARVNLGVDEADAWAEIARQEPALASLGREVARSVGSGLALAGTVRALGFEARREARAAQELRAKRVGVRSVLPLMVCFLPAFLLLGVVPIIGGVVDRLTG